MPVASGTLSRVWKRYGAVEAVKDVSFEVHDREFLVLVGPSGCGKTTTLRMVAGLEDISDGEIHIGGRLVNDVAPKDRDIAMVFQNYALYPHMTVRDNMAFALELRRTGRAEIERRVANAAEILGIGGLLRRRPRELSGGQRQRVALGRAIVREPAVFLMDEPLSNLDAKLRVQTRAELIKLHRRLQCTVIYVTHDQVEAMTMSTRVAVMRDGTLQQLDAPQTIYERPGNRFVAEFIGSPAMNFLEVRLSGAWPDLLAEHHAFRLPVTRSRVPALAGYAGRHVTLGVRPEHLRLQRTPDPDTLGLPARVDLVEPLGSEAIVTLIVGEEWVTARVAYDPDLRNGDIVTVQPDLNKLHFFDLTTGEALL
ncbi:MAG: sn-glycerol-3-phosphate ABC transporter ATP-binding protein UgpC [Chloroflexi bacterium]|nr:sn-glycerol-3-phosphate ABC transporter ATP-binding protein UgpC [Chloroflexota bacterium]